MKDTVATVLELTVQNGGGTFEAGSWLPFEPKHGYAVAFGGYQPLAKDVDLNALRKLLKTVQGEYDSSFVGTWLDGEKLYVDAVVYTVDLTRAIELAQSTNQLAIYNFATGESIAVAATGV